MPPKNIAWLLLVLVPHIVVSSFPDCGDKNECRDETASCSGCDPSCADEDSCNNLNFTCIASIVVFEKIRKSNVCFRVRAYFRM